MKEIASRLSTCAVATRLLGAFLVAGLVGSCAAEVRAQAQAPRQKDSNVCKESKVDKRDDAAFQEAARRYRDTSTKPDLPEEARKLTVQADLAVTDRHLDSAVDRYADALKLAPWWPQGHFNRALLLGEQSCYGDAVREMKKYLDLEPNGPDSSAAQDRVSQWESAQQGAKKAPSGRKK
jgi:hypothetical protein